MRQMNHGVELGIECLVDGERHRIRGRRVALLAHPASVNHDYIHALTLLRQAGAAVKVLFGPEHGFMGETQDMEPVAGIAVHSSGIPIRSLYGHTADTLAPTPGDLNGLDAVVVDLQDVGARYYTFIWTALLTLRACREAGVEMILTDRANPIGGDRVEGAPQEEGYLSFVGLKKVAVRHGMTIGELVAMAAEEEGIADVLTVIRMTGWQRHLFLDETDIGWVMPSPNMPTEETAMVYPGMCLVEGTECSEGRGTTRPFELVGGSGINGERLAKRLADYALPGVLFRPVSFIPGFQKHKDTRCSGVQLHVRARRKFLPFRTGVAVLLALKAEANEQFRWRHAPYEFVEEIPAIDLLTGSSVVRTMVEEGAPLEEIADTWADRERAFNEQRAPFLFY
jgi:uncharacterized protein YbbC (DUF1343 family)